MVQALADPRQPTVLVVDDDRNTVELIKTVLRARGYATMMAYSGAEALEIIEDMAGHTSGWQPLPVDVIILDIMMPVVDGFKVCQRVKEDPILKYVPVIMLTALAKSSDKVAAVAFGADGYITKPFLPEELAAAVKAKLQIKEREEALLRRNKELEALDAISAAAARTLDPQRVLDESFAALVEHADLAAAAIYQADEVAHLLRSAIQWGVRRPETQPLEEGLPGQIFTTQQPLLEINLPSSVSLPSATLEGQPLAAFIGVPLRSVERSLGVLEVYHARPYGFRNQDLELYRTIGERIGIALQNAEIFQSMQKLLSESSS
jgi:DNA-binding response OmpR family regulator